MAFFVFSLTVSQVKVDSVDFDFRRWPALLSEFDTLEKLEISKRKRDFWDLSVFKITVMPKTLLTLKNGLRLDASFFEHLSFSEWIPQLEELDFPSRDLDVVKYLGSGLKQKYLRVYHWSSEPLPAELAQLHVVDEINASPNLKLDSIPSGLRKLELSGDWRKQVDTLFGDNGAILKLNEHLPHLESLDFRCLTFTTYSWMTHSPQSLTNLRIDQWDGHVELPTSLIHFKTHSVTLSTSSFVSKLPPSLETFYTYDLIGVELIVPLLPPTLRKLSLGYELQYSDGPRSPQNILEQLPKGLTWFTVPRSSSEINLEANPELVSFLPTTLTELRLLPRQFLPCSSWFLFPPRLTNLLFRGSSDLLTLEMIDNHGVHRQVKSIPFDRLPKSLTRLELIGGSCFSGPPITSNLPYFPPQLTCLKIPSIQMSPQTAKLLPSSLTYLEIGNLSEHVCEHLPNSLTTLMSSGVLMTPNLIKFLPKSLTTLNISIPSSVFNWYDHHTGEAVESLSSLPEYPIHKKCLLKDFDWKDHSPLPSTLTYLTITGAPELEDTFLQHQQLPNLLELSLDNSKHFSDISIPLLPPHLMTLNLPSSSNVSGKSFEFLPRGLTHLNLNSSKSIFDSDIQHLPRTLKTAILRNAIHLTDLCIPDLPPHLECLNTRFNTHLSPSPQRSWVPRPRMIRMM